MLADHHSAPIAAPLAAALDFLAKLCREPEAVTSADAARALAAGVSAAALADTVWVCVTFSVYTRVADGLGFDQLDEGGFAYGAARLWRSGYL